jgi:hypothetical protein
LIEVGLMGRDEVREFLARNPKGRQAGQAEPFALDLVRAGKLTEYQAGALLQGKARGLAIGNYVILDKLGRGGMGLVLRAQHRRMKRIVALKVLPPSYARNQAAVQRFHREAEAVARLGHPNIVAALDASEYGGLHFLAMEYVDGTDLAGLVRAQGPLAVDRAIECVTQAARGLGAAHAEGIYHRDIKPSNLILDTGGRVKILDLGLARFESQADLLGSAEADPSLTRPGDLMGTVAFMSPEQAYNAQDADHRSDIYSLGCTLYFLLTARPPYSGVTPMACLLAHREQPIPSLRAVRPEAPQRLDLVLGRMLAKSPEDRHPSTDAVIADLESCLGPEPEADPVPVPVPVPVPGPAVSPPADPTTEVATATTSGSRLPLRGVALAAAGGLLGAIVMGMGGRWWVRPRETAAANAGLEAAAPIGSPGEPGAPATGPENAPPPASRPAEAASEEPRPIETVGEVHRFRDMGNVRVEGIAVSADGGQALTAGDDGRVRCWEVSTGSEIRAPFVHDEAVLAVTFSPDGLYALSGGRDRLARIWDLTSGRVIRRFAGHEKAIFSVAYSPDGRRVLTGGGDGTVRLWDVPTQVQVDRRVHDDSVTAVAFSPDGRRALSGSDDRTVRLWDLEDAGGKAIRRFEARAQVQCVAYSPGGDRALSGGSDGALTLWDLAGGPGPMIRRLDARGDWIRCVSFLPDGRHAVAGTEGGKLILWDLEGEREVEVHPPLKVPARHLGVVALPDGLHALTANDDGFARYWRLPELHGAAPQAEGAARVRGP